MLRVVYILRRCECLYKVNISLLVFVLKLLDRMNTAIIDVRHSFFMIVSIVGFIKNWNIHFILFFIIILQSAFRSLVRVKKI